MTLEKNSIHTAEITGYTSEGMGLCRVDGQVVFVERGVRGDLCRLRIVKGLKNKAYARIEELLRPSEARQEAGCPAFPRCGGCDFWHMTYEEELYYKKQRVQDALERLAGTPYPGLEIVGGKVEGYRNKAMYPCALIEGVPQAGFYRRRSHQVVPTSRCAIQPPQADALKEAVLGWARQNGVSIYREEDHQGLLRHIYVRTGKGGALLTVVVTQDALPQEEDLVRRCRAACPELAGIVINENPVRTNRVLGVACRTLWGDGRLADTLCGVEFSLSPLSFYQVNHDQAQKLYQTAVEFAGFQPEDTLLDMYCGTGTITLVMARHCRQAVGVEIVPEAVEDARQNAEKNRIHNVRFLCADAGQAAHQLEQEGFRPSVVVVDPPRKGLDEGARQALQALSPQRIVYVSCDPATMARDIKALGAAGYQLKNAKALDLFPRTANVETVVLLSKGEVDSKKIRVEFSLEDMDMSEFQDGATYPQIKEYVLEHTGLKVSNLYISQIKRKCGIEVGKNYNLPKSEDSRQPQCPQEKEKAIREAFKYFGMI